MRDSKTNPSIRCSVTQCAHHCKDYCNLDQIQVGCSKTTVMTCDGTECASFEMGQSYRSAQ